MSPKSEEELALLMDLPREDAQKLADFLSYSNLHPQIDPANGEDLHSILIPVAEEQTARRLAGAFLKEAMPESSSSKQTPGSLSALSKHTYTPAAQRYEDAKGTLFILLIAAIFLTSCSLSVTITHFSEIIHFRYSGYLSYIVFWIISLLLIWGTFQYHRIRTELKQQAGEEEHWHQNVSSWLRDNFTAERIDEAIRETDTPLQEELLVLSRYDYLRQEASSAFPDIDPGFLDLEIEQFYETIFE